METVASIADYALWLILGWAYLLGVVLVCSVIPLDSNEDSALGPWDLVVALAWPAILGLVLLCAGLRRVQK